MVDENTRIWMVGQGIHSWGMEGAEPDAQSKADMVAFALGEMTSEEVVRRGRVRFGLE